MTPEPDEADVRPIGRPRFRSRGHDRDPRRRARAVRRAADAALRAERLRAERSPDLRDRAEGADHVRPRAPRVRRRDAREALRDLRRARALAVDDPQLPVVSLERDGQLVHGRHDVRPRGAVHVGSRGRRRALRLGAARRRRPADDALHRPHPLPGPRAPGPGRPPAVEPVGAVPDAGLGLEEHDQAPPRQLELRAAARRHDRRARPSTSASAACTAMDAVVLDLLEHAPAGDAEGALG